MEKKIVYDAVVLSLIGQGLTQRAATAVLASTRMRQDSEWKEIAGRSEVGAISRIYVIVRRPDQGLDSDFIARNPEHLAAFVYAPREQDNIRHIIDFASQGPDIGAGPDDPATETVIGYYPVSAYDVGPDVKKAVGHPSH